MRQEVKLPVYRRPIPSRILKFFGCPLPRLRCAKFFGCPLPRLRCAFLLVTALFLPSVAYAQNSKDEQYKIRAKVDLVVVPVTVKDEGGKLITNLKKEDFIVLEDGRRQTLSNFTVDPVPLSAAVVVDTGLGYDALARVQKTFPALVGAFSPFDEVAVYKYDKFVTKVLDFSGNTESVQAAMDKLREIQPRAATTIDPTIARGPFSIPGPVINGQPVVPPANLGIISPLPPKTSNVLNDAIFTAAADLAKRERNRRKIVLVVSDGENGGNDHSFDETTKSLLETGIQVYSVALDLPFPYKVNTVLEDYARTTGGDVFFANSIHSIERSYADATEQARNQYILAYISNNELRTEGPVFRDIQVRIAGNNFKTLYRKGYYQYP
jgi:VWFA-related protein